MKKHSTHKNNFFVPARAQRGRKNFAVRQLETKFPEFAETGRKFAMAFMLDLRGTVYNVQQVCHSNHKNTPYPVIEITRPPPPLSCPTPGKTVPRHPLGDGCQVMVPHPPPVQPPYTHIFRHRSLHCKTKEYSIPPAGKMRSKGCQCTELCCSARVEDKASDWAGQCGERTRGSEKRRSESEQHALPRVQGIQLAVPHNTVTHTTTQ